MRKSDLIKFLSGREITYSFLGRVFEREVDRRLLENLISRKEMLLRYKSLNDPNAITIKEGFEELSKYLSTLDEGRMNETVLELAADYANLFLGVKYAFFGKGIPHPSESAYTDGHLYGDVIDRVFEAYLEGNLVKSPNFHEPEDHIALELYFMAHLCRKAITSLNNEIYQDLLKYLNMQKDFLSEHLLRWAPRLADDIIKNANTLFYKAIGKILKGFLSIEEKIIDEVIEQMKTMFSEKLS
ncbi:MAG: molecular chaperone TorD family protein [Candidatus Bathyarchaeia archaeon]